MTDVQDLQRAAVTRVEMHSARRGARLLLFDHHPPILKAIAGRSSSPDERPTNCVTYFFFASVMT